MTNVGTLASAMDWPLLTGGKGTQRAHAKYGYAFSIFRDIAGRLTEWGIRRDTGLYAGIASSVPVAEIGIMPYRCQRGLVSNCAANSSTTFATRWRLCVAM